MNTELKALLDLIFDGESLVAKLVAKQNFFTLLPQVFSILTADLPNAVNNWGSLQAEIAALPGTAQEADLVAYVQKKFALAVSDDAKAQAILAAVLKVVLGAADLATALK